MNDDDVNAAAAVVVAKIESTCDDDDDGCCYCYRWCSEMPSFLATQNDSLMKRFEMLIKTDLLELMKEDKYVRHRQKMNDEMITPLLPGTLLMRKRM